MTFVGLYFRGTHPSWSKAELDCDIGEGDEFMSTLASITSNILQTSLSQFQNDIMMTRLCHPIPQGHM
jgi:hypothetical protein